jgi:hypothetical protein
MSIFMGWWIKSWFINISQIVLLFTKIIVYLYDLRHITKPPKYSILKPSHTRPTSRIIWYSTIGQPIFHFTYIEINLSSPIEPLWRVKCALFYIMLILIPSRGVLLSIEGWIMIISRLSYLIIYYYTYRNYLLVW